MKENRQYFDFSDSLRLDMKDNTNKKVPGVFSDDMHSLIIKKITWLNPKCYSYIKTTLEEMARSYPNLFKYYEDPTDKILTEVEGKKAKGVPTVVIKNELKNKNYYDTLITDISEIKEVTTLRSFDYKIYTYTSNKVVLTSYYDKMQIINSDDCVPFGYKKINSM